MEKLTERQRQILVFVRNYIVENSYPPTLQEITRAFSFASPTAAAAHLQALHKKGFIRKVEGISRGIVLTRERTAGVRIPVLGQVPAGKPVSEEEDAGEDLVFDPRLAGTGDIFALRVKGDSMKDAGILDGDYVLVNKGGSARSGAIVVALLDGEFTVKFFSRQGEAIELKPANPAFEPIPVQGNLEVFGTVTGVFRKLT